MTLIEVGKPGMATHMNSLSPLARIEEEWEFEVVLGNMMRTSESKTNSQDGEGLSFEVQLAALAALYVFVHHYSSFLILLCKEFCILWKFYDCSVT